jgi:hypothetical protein
MKLLPVLLVAGLLAFTGCFGKSGTPATPTPTPATGPTPTGTGATPTSPTSGGTNTTPPTPVALPPKDVCTVSYDFSTPMAPNAAAAPISCVVPAGYKKLTLNVTFTSKAAAGPNPGISNGIKLDLNDPTGSSAASCPIATGPQTAAVPPCMAVTSSAAPGEWKVQPSGAGTYTASGVVTASQ